MSTPFDPAFRPGSDPDQFGSEQPTYTGHDVLDEQSNHVGKVTDVIYDEDSGLAAPSWLVVDPGLLRQAHYVPVEGSYRTDEGAIVVPWDKEWIKSSTKAIGDHVLTTDLRDELATHYSADV
jgi:uncharacterized protein YrrD